MQTFPAWVTDFNGQKLQDNYLNQTWNLLLPTETYQGVADKTAFEEPFKGTSGAVFPYDLKEIRTQYSPVLINSTPYGNSFTLDFTRAVIKNEQLGADDVTDFGTEFLFSRLRGTPLWPPIVGNNGHLRPF